MASNVNDLQQANAGLAIAPNGPNGVSSVFHCLGACFHINPLHTVLRGCELVSLLFESLPMLRSPSLH
jgi:hypothetical protein